MSDESNQALEESLAMAKQLQAEEEAADREVAILENQIDNADSHPDHTGESISNYVSQPIA